MNLIRRTPPDPYDYLPTVDSFALASRTLVDNGPLPQPQASPASGGEGHSPHLSWSGAPSITRSFAVTCFDPDAPTVSGFWHWMVINIPATTTEIPGGGDASFHAHTPGAVIIKNDMGDNDYLGAAPPAGDRPHRYIFTVHALNVETLPLDETKQAPLAAFHIVPATIGRAHLTALM